MSFLDYFFEERGNILIEGENQVLCPFPHMIAGDMSFSESRPSASVNTDKKLFHCMSCGRGLNEVQFIEQYFGCDQNMARKIADAFERTNESITNWDENDNGGGLIDIELPINQQTRSRAHALGISDYAIEKMRIRTYNHPSRDNIMVFPIDMCGAVLDHKYYDPFDEHHPKTKEAKKFWVRGGVPNGLVIPWENLINTPNDKWLFICAGEKDVATLVQNGFNAVTITGGENQYKIAVPNLFKGRKVAIVYDNDEAGLAGAKKVAAYLYEKGCTTIRNVTGHHSVCIEKGEDITDFFFKYGKNVDDLKKIVMETPLYEPTPDELQSIGVEENHEALAILDESPIIDLYTATLPQYEGKLVRSIIQVISSEDITYSYPKEATVKKIKAASKETPKDWYIGQQANWELKYANSEDILYLVDENFKEKEILDNIKNLVFANRKEEGIAVTVHNRGVVFRASVQDFVEDKTKEVKQMSYNALSLDVMLESGKKYLITYKIVPNPHKGARKAMIICRAEEAEDSVSKFEVTEEVKDTLFKFKNKGTDFFVDEFKKHLGFQPLDTLIKAVDLSFHTPLEFYIKNSFNENEKIRGTLDTLIVGESRVGKSASTKKCVELYGLGQVVSLAGKSATTNGLIGGSMKVGSSDRYATKAGVLPMNHKGLVVLEELGKASNDLMRELTDVRSSNRVRITRVDSTVDFPCMLRTIYLTNPKSKDGSIQSIASFPNGIEIVTGLVAAPEDIARFDIIVVIPDLRIQKDLSDPKFYNADEYKTRIRWIWSRKPEQIIITDEAEILLKRLTKDLNYKYETHIKIFGTELRYKLARLAVAIAGYNVSSDEEYNNIVVLPEHIQEAALFFENDLYNNSTFKMAQYVDNQRRYTVFTQEGLDTLNMVFNKPNGSSLVYALDRTSMCTTNELQAHTGLDRGELNTLLQPLLKACLIQFSDQNRIRPTEKYRVTRPKVTSTRVRELIDQRGDM